MRTSSRPNLLKTLLVTAGFIAAAHRAISAQQPTVSTQSEAVPAQLATPLQALVGTSGARVQLGKTIVDLWWVKAVPLAAASAGTPAWAQVREGTIVGAIRITDKYADIRGKTIQPGVYTLRFAWQPKNGDHLGVSPFREFLLLSPAADDKDPRPLDLDTLVELSKKVSGAKHPAVLGLDPPAATEPVYSILKNDEFNLRAVVLEIPASRSGQPAGVMRFGLVVAGIIEA